MKESRGSILVTGGSGFIGSHVVRALVIAGYVVTVLDSLVVNPKLDINAFDIEFVKGDVTDRELVFSLMRNRDFCIHLAAVLGVEIVANNNVKTMEVEVCGMKNIADAAVAYGVTVIYSSTSGVYGKYLIDKSVSEEVPAQPSSSYAIAKRYNEIYLKQCSTEKGLASVSLRLFNVYGPVQDNRMVLPRFIESAISGEDLRVFSPGTQTRDMTYVDDVVDAVLRVLLLPKNCYLFNIAGGDEISMVDLAKKVISMTKSTSSIEFVTDLKRLEFDVDRRSGDSSRLAEYTGKYYYVPLEEGLRRTIDWFKA